MSQDNRQRQRQEGPALRLPPHSVEAEQGVLACCLLAPAEVLPEVLGKLGEDEAFYDLRHQTLLQCLRAMSDARMHIDMLTVPQRLKDGGLLEQAGGLAYVSGLMDCAPSAANLSAYLDTVLDKWKRRKALKMVGELQIAIYDEAIPADDVVAKATAGVMKLSESVTLDDVKTLGAELPSIVDELESVSRGHKVMTGMSTGFNYLDNMTAGFGSQDYVVIGGRPSLGKTALAMQIAENVALGQDKSVCVFSLEMSRRGLASRMLFSRANANLMKWRNGFPQPHVLPDLVRSAGELSKAKIHVQQMTRMNARQLAIAARRAKSQFDVSLFVLDYLQLMQGTGELARGDGRAQELAQVSQVICELKKELNTPWIVVAQLNRDSEKEPDRPPRLSDLKDTGQIEQDADLVGILYKPVLKHYRKDPTSDLGKQDVDFLTKTPAQSLPKEFLGNDWETYINLVKIEVLKQRNGPTGSCSMLYIRPWVRFMDAYVREKTREAAEPRPRGKNNEMVLPDCFTPAQHESFESANDGDPLPYVKPHAKRKE